MSGIFIGADITEFPPSFIWSIFKPKGFIRGEDLEFLPTVPSPQVLIERLSIEVLRGLRVLAGWALNKKLRELPYKEYLETPEWLTKRLEKLEQVGYRCQRCDSSLDLQVHHLNYRHLGEEDLIRDLIVLCDGCHCRYHNLLPLRAA
jgi:hypothetical protein